LPAKSGSRGKFRGVATEVRARIEAGAWKAGQPIPSEAELCREFAISRGTVRAALAELEANGLLRVIPGKGRVVDGGPSSRAAGVESISVAQIVDELRARLSESGPSEGDAFVSERDVMEQYHVTRHVARRALAGLEAAGLLTSQQGRRRQVTARAASAKPSS
jgi:DNA-binding GntR family transcriptional regulator